MIADIIISLYTKNHVNFNISNNINSLLWLAHKRFPSRFPATLQEKVELNSTFSCGKKYKRFLYYDKFILFSVSVSVPAAKRMSGNPT